MHIYQKTEGIWEALRNKAIFITGGTGFFGKWLLESFAFVNEKLQLGASITVLTRNPKKFLNEFPFYRERGGVRFIEGDILNFHFPSGDYDYIIHAATEADAALNTSQPLKMIDTITVGTRRMLEFAREKLVDSFLFVSSGAVYGKQPDDVTHIKESQSFPVNINIPHSAYAEGKRIAELYCSIYHSNYNIPVKIARCFAFVGPHLPLDKHFAIGNFILNALNGEDIVLKGDGTPYRSFLYAADLAIWLWTILVKGENNFPYNVGSDEDINLANLANLIKEMKYLPGVKILTPPKPGKPVERYVPNVELAKQSLGLEVEIKLKEALENTFKFYQN
jgi:nucleoside-diphosphate-sugar epimerase